MNPCFSPIHHTFAPLADRRFCLRALLLLLQPWKWTQGQSVALLEAEISREFGADVVTFSSGREGLMSLLRAMRVERGDEVIVQGYTCVVVPNAILAAGATPVFVDIERDTLNLDVTEVARAITPRTRAVICQHTFGIPAATPELRALCESRGLALIEDCAHVIPDASGPEDVGTHGDFLLLSFGRDKAISGISGGAIVSRHKLLTQGLRSHQRAAQSLPWYEVGRLLLYPLLYAVARPLYGVTVGKALLKAASVCKLLPKIVTDDEKRGRMASSPHRLPEACAALALDQWRRRKQLNDHRRAATRYLLERGSALHIFATRTQDDPLPRAVKLGLPLQKLPLFVRGADDIRARLVEKNIHLDDGWTGCVICPDSVQPEAAGYRPGSDPQAEQVCIQILSLPTHPGVTPEQLDRLLQALVPMLAPPSRPPHHP